MRVLVLTSAILMAASLPAVEAADAPEPAAPARATSDGIDLQQLIESSAKRLNKRFIVDPRLRGQALLVNIEPERLSYRELQAVLSVHGFIATQETEGTVRIIPDANMRQVPMPVLEAGSNKSVGEEDIVTRTIDVGSLSATALVPLLRPLLPQPAHLVAHPETNSLIVVDRQGNVRKLEAIVRDLRARPTREAKEGAQ